MTIKTGSIGIPLRVATGFDLSSFTALTMKLSKPDGTVLTKTSGAGEVTAPAVALVADPDLGNVAASTYFEYINTVDDYDQSGDEIDINAWTVCGIYVDATQTLPTAPVPFTVLEGC